MKRSFKWDKKYLHWGITAFFVIAGEILLFYILKNLPQIAGALSGLGAILRPFIWGLIITYLFTPLLHGLDRKCPRWLSVLICEIIVLLILAAFVMLIIPQLYSSLETIVVNSPQYIEKAGQFIDRTFKNNPELEASLSSLAGEFSEGLTGIIKTKLLPSLGSVVSNVTTGVVYVFKVLYNLIIGIIVSAYILARIERFTAGARKILYSIFTIEAAEKIRQGIRFADRAFMGFFSGKLLDSAIIGMLCYIFCALVGMPYAFLVSVIVGVTNIIPFFGPFIGAIPSALIIVLVNPVKCLIFVVFIIVLQQLDGNFIGPKILGSSIGINGFWVMFSIILGGGLFGFWGMLLGVPVWVCIYAAIENAVNRKLQRSELPTEPSEYIHLDYIDPETGEVHKKLQAASGEKLQATSCKLQVDEGERK